jgi:hypothetical protein
MFGQVIEGYFCRDFNWGNDNAKTITISFDAYSSIAATLPLSIRNASLTRTWLGSFTLAANTLTSVSFTIPGDITGTWEYTNLCGMEIEIGLGIGPNHTGVDGWQAASKVGLAGMTNFMATAGATLYLTKFQVELGPVATEFERVPYDEQLRRCQRYYWKGLPAQYYNMNSYAHGAISSWSIMFPTTMRATPTMVNDFTGSTFPSLVGNPGGDVPTTSGFRLIAQTVGAGTNHSLNFGAASYFSASAEL